MHFQALSCNGRLPKSLQIRYLASTDGTHNAGVKGEIGPDLGPITAGKNAEDPDGLGTDSSHLNGQERLPVHVNRDVAV